MDGMVMIAAGKTRIRMMEIAGRCVGEGQPTFIIAEVGINHNGSPQAAERLIREAAKAGADAVKFQTYLTEQRVPRTSPIFELLKRCELSFDQQAQLKAVAQREGILFFSTPFDEPSVEFLQGLDAPAYKIASFDIVNLRLIRRVTATGRPVIMSRGMASAQEIDRAVAIFEGAHVSYALLHCVSAYPTPADQANLRVMRTLAAHYRCPIGFSDHTLGIDVPVWAVAAGAALIEKHFTLDRSQPGPDHQLSADPGQLTEMVGRIRAVERSLGQGALGVAEAERGTLIYRRPSA